MKTIASVSAYETPEVMQITIAARKVIAASDWNNAEISGQFNDIYDGVL